MRGIFMAGIAIVSLSACSTGGLEHFSTYDLDRDGVLDRRCAGTEYETDRNTWYGWRSKASKECAKNQPLPVENPHLVGTPYEVAAES